MHNTMKDVNLMKILITGVNGMLGTDLTQLFTPQFEVTAIDIQQLDLTDNNATIDYITNLKPHIIINCAAYTNVDGCETEIDTAYKANAVAPRNIAVASNNINAKFLHISTDYVFDGETNKPYKEDDTTNPLSIYGKSKLMGEDLVKCFSNKYFILRTQWLYGKNGNNFAKTMLKLANESPSIKVVNDQFGSPTYTRDLCTVIEQIIKTENYGTYHITNSGVTSWYEFAKTIFTLTNIKVDLRPCTTEEFPRPAHRPKFSKLDNYFWRINGFNELRNYKEALKDYLKETGVNL